MGDTGVDNKEHRSRREALSYRGYEALIRLEDLELLAVRGSIATYATDADTPSVPFWPLLFKNIRVDFLGSDDFTAAYKPRPPARSTTR